MDRLYDKLKAYMEEDYYPMHMPGHKRNVELLTMDNPYSLDITEIGGFDNLHQPEGILKSLAQRLSRMYGAGASFPLVNGSTAGILAGISAAVHRGDKILLARNSHKSVYHAAILMGLEPVYINPELIGSLPVYGGISAEIIEDMLINNKDVRLVVITSPTYEGVVSDIGNIARTVHRHGALLLVDEAHGAHFGFHESFPESAVTQGADLVIQSLHKTLPAFTQTAVLHSNREALNFKLQKYLAIYQSSSPSYLLLAGMDRCISMLEDRGKELFDAYAKRLNHFYHSLEGLSGLELLYPQITGGTGAFNQDPSKITVFTRKAGISGHQLQEILHNKYHIDIEMAARDYILAMTSICDTQQGFDRLSKALLEIDKEYGKTREAYTEAENTQRLPEQVIFPYQAVEKTSEMIRFAESTGRISAAFVSLFPPGSPLLVPGERISKALIGDIQGVLKAGITVTGLSGEEADLIEVVKEQA